MEECETIGGETVHLTGHRGTSEEHLKRAMLCLSRPHSQYGSILAPPVPLDVALTRLNNDMGIKDGSQPLVHGKLVIAMREHGERQACTA